MDRTSDDSGTGPSYLVYEFERRAYPLSDAKFTIGRDAGSDIVVREPSVSRSHAEVQLDGDEFVVTSTGATGTLLNGEPLTVPSKLEDGDKIGVGTLEFTYRRGRLPLGVSVVDTMSADGHNPDAMTKRDTIKSPILGGSQVAPAARKKSPVATIVLFALMIAAAGWYLFFR
jgi:pSer/pThr/pTyr-binding forkhead associated (FHA) protein